MKQPSPPTQEVTAGIEKPSDLTLRRWPAPFFVRGTEAVKGAADCLRRSVGIVAEWEGVALDGKERIMPLNRDEVLSCICGFSDRVVDAKIADRLRPLIGCKDEEFRYKILPILDTAVHGALASSLVIEAMSRLWEEVGGLRSDVPPGESF